MKLTNKAIEEIINSNITGDVIKVEEVCIDFGAKWYGLGIVGKSCQYGCNWNALKEGTFTIEECQKVIDSINKHQEVMRGLRK